MSERQCMEEDCIHHGTVDAGSCVVCQLLADAHAAGREAGMREAVEVIRPLHNAVVTAWPALAHLPPVAAVTAFLATMEKPHE